jgi:hypothetical protein
VVELILRNSDPPDQKLGSEITVKEKYVLKGTVKLNGDALAGARVSLPMGNETMETVSGPDGPYKFEYTARTCVESDVIFEVPQSIGVSSDYLGFHITMDMYPYQDNDFTFDFEDVSPPSILSVERDPMNFDQQKFITISTVISDQGSAVVAEVTLQYRVSGGDWKNITMFNVEGDTYQGVLPRAKIGQVMEYRIVAVDGVGNQVVSQEKTIEIGSEFVIAGWTLLIILILIAITFGVVKMFGWVRIREYLRRGFKGERRTLSDFHKKGVM